MLASNSKDLVNTSNAHEWQTPDKELALALAPSRRFPQFDAVAFAVDDPREMSSSFVAGAFRIDLHPVCGELDKQRVEVVHAEVNHRLLRHRTEVGRVGVEGTPNGTCILVRVIGPIQLCEAVIVRQTQMLLIPRA